MTRPIQIISFLFIFYSVSVQAVTMWAPGRQLSSGTKDSELRFNWGQAIAVDGRGILHQTWLENSGLENPSDPNSIIGQVFYRRSTDNGVTWSDSTPIIFSAPYTGHPKIAASGDHIYVVWHGAYGSTLPRIVMRHSPDSGLNWGTPVLVSNEVALWPTVFAQLNAVHISWAAQDPLTGYQEVYLRSSSNYGTGWTPTRMVSSSDGKSSWTPAVAAWGPVIHVVWTDERHDSVDCFATNNTIDCHEELYYRRSMNFGQTWDAEKRLTNDSGAPQSTWAASIAVSDQSAHLVFFDKRSGSFQIYHKRSVDGGTNWFGETRLTQDSTTEYSRPVIALLDQELHVSFWGVIPNQGAFINYTQSTNNGLSFTAPSIVSSGHGYSMMPSITVSPNRSVHLIWHDRDSAGHNQIFYSRGIPKSN